MCPSRRVSGTVFACDAGLQMCIRDRTLTEILDKVYRSPAPNKFLASLVPFLKDNLWNPYVYSVVLEELTAFIRKNVAMLSLIHISPWEGQAQERC